MSEPREMNLTDAQFEHTLGVLAEVDLTPLVNAFQGNGSLMDILVMLPMLGQAREKKILRRLEAIWSAEPEDLEGAEADPANMERLERKAARTPVTRTLAGLQAFFGGLGLSLSGTPGSSEAQIPAMNKNLKKKLGLSPEPSPSEG
jgi:hypothetical protein